VQYAADNPSHNQEYDKDHHGKWESDNNALPVDHLYYPLFLPADFTAHVARVTGQRHCVVWFAAQDHGAGMGLPHP
jgi:hypothetical protein